MKTTAIHSFLMRAACTLLIALASWTSAWAEQSGVWTYIINSTGTECWITGYTGNDISAITIPKEINGVPVYYVSANFSGYNMRWLFFYEDTKIVEMPNVQNCLYLTNVNLINDSGETVETNRLPNSMTNIANAFMGSGIVELTMPNVTTIGDYAFEGCNNLTKVTFGKAALIGEYAFSKIRPTDKTRKCEVSYPGPMANWDWKNYQYSKNIVVNCNDGSCGWCGDEWTDNLWHDSCLYWTLDTSGHLNIDCVPLDDFFENYGPQQVLSYSKGAFWDKTKVTSLTLNHVYSISNKVFFGHNVLKTLEAGNGLVSIGQEAFSGCSLLQSVMIPSSVKSLGISSFYGCSSLIDFYFDGSENQWNNSVTKALGWNTNVPSSFTVHWRCGVTFDMHGHGTAPDTQYPWSDLETVTRPADPTASGFVFTGWYNEAECTTLYDFDTVVYHDMTIHAGWASQPCAATLTAAATVEIPYGQEWTEIPVTVNSLTLGWFQNQGKPVRQAYYMKITPFIGSAEHGSVSFVSGSRLLNGYWGIGAHNIGNGLSEAFTEAGQSTNLWIYIPQESWESAVGGTYSKSMNYDAVFYCNAIDPEESYNYYNTIGIGNIGKVAIKLKVPQAVTLSFNANGGEGEMTPVNTRAGFAAQVPSCDFTNGENVFMEWNTESDGSGTTYLPGEEFTIKSNVTLYAQWGKEYVVDLTATSERAVPDVLLGELTTLGGYFESMDDGSGEGQMMLDLNLDGTPDVLLVMPEYDFENDEFLGDCTIRKLAGAASLTANYRFRLYFETDEVYQFVHFKFGNGYEVISQPVIELLYEDIDNAYFLPDLKDGRRHTVMLYGHTLHKGGVWNALCLPFSLGSLDSTPLEGATLMMLDSSECSDGTLTLNFSEADAVVAGTPFLVKYPTGTDLVNPQFRNVVINDELQPVETSVADFVGHYGWMDKNDEDKSLLMLDKHNRLTWPQSPMTIYAFTAWFQLKGNLEATENVQDYVLNLGDEVITGTFDDTAVATGLGEASPLNDNGKMIDDRSGWYTLDGRKLNGKPAAKGVYLWNNRKVIVK